MTLDTVDKLLIVGLVVGIIISMFLPFLLWIGFCLITVAVAIILDLRRENVPEDNTGSEH